MSDLRTEAMTLIAQVRQQMGHDEDCPAFWGDRCVCTRGARIDVELARRWAKSIYAASTEMGDSAMIQIRALASARTP